MEYVVLAWPVVLMAALFGLERIERWMDSAPRTMPKRISQPDQQLPLVAPRRGRAAPLRWRPSIRLIGKPSLSRVRYRRMPIDDTGDLQNQRDAAA
jgi:hypothetical protein